MYKIVTYNSEYEGTWDEFILNKSINGTFLQSRGFLNYHPKERFKDCSLLFYNQNNELIAICGACELYEKSKKIFYSHKGATYGGLIIEKKYYKSKYVIPLVKEFTEYLKSQGFDEVYLKLTPEIFAQGSTALLEFALHNLGYSDFKDINTYIDYNNYNENILTNFTQGKRTHVHRCQREGMQVRTIYEDSEVSQYYDILCENLEKYDIKPVHTLSELLDFKNNRLINECEFFGTYLKDDMVAGGMLFYFYNSKTAHTQYLSAKKEYLSMSPMTFTYYWLIDEMKRRGFKYLSWGVASENLGRNLNEGLINSKEDFGSTYGINITYYLNFH